jgi:asparagine synthase (glutamine-hydrolysing)
MGLACLSELRGMFGMVIADLRDRAVYLAVDIWGMKPLHWAHSESTLIVASEPRAIQEYLGASEVDTGSIARFLLHGSLAPDQSGLRDIHRLGPGELVRFQYPQLANPVSTLIAHIRNSTKSTWDEVADTFRESVCLHQTADVPVALLLSDGVDSTAIAEVAAQSQENLTALTVSIGGSSRSELHGALETAQALGINHLSVESLPDDQTLQDFSSAMQRPTIDGLNTFLISKAIREAGFKAALSGVGGDELLTAYLSMKDIVGSYLVSRLPSQIAARFIALAGVKNSQTSQEKLALIHSGGSQHRAHVAVALKRQVWDQQSVAKMTGQAPSIDIQISNYLAGYRETFANEASSAQISLYLTSQLLPDADIFSMFNGVEIRMPFVDSDVASSIARIPHRALHKRRFVEALGGPLLLESSKRPKQGFAMPMNDLLRESYLAVHVDRLRDRDSAVYRTLNPAILQQALREWDSHKLTWPRIWALAVLNLWLENRVQKLP